MVANIRLGLWTLVLALLAGGCPLQAIVFAFEFDERTVTDWQVKTGQHAQQIQEQVMCQGQVDSNEFVMSGSPNRVVCPRRSTIAAQYAQWRGGKIAQSIAHRIP